MRLEDFHGRRRMEPRAFSTYDQIRLHGVIGNLNDGVEITTQGVGTRLIAWL